MINKAKIESISQEAEKFQRLHWRENLLACPSLGSKEDANRFLESVKKLK